MKLNLLLAFACGAGFTFGVCQWVYGRQLARMTAERDLTTLTLSALLQPPIQKIACDLEKPQPQNLDGARKSCLVVVRMFIDTYERFTRQYPKADNPFAEEYAKAKQFLELHDGGATTHKASSQ